jgi:hypothetical protein
MARFEKDRRNGRDRRQKPTKPFTRYMLFGRRRTIRRGADRKTNVYVDLYGHSILLFLLLIVLLSIFDAYFTIFHVEQGAQEINPFMNFLIGHGSITFFAIKYILTALGIVLLCIYQSLPITRTIIVCVFFFYLTVFANHIFLILRR